VGHQPPTSVISQWRHVEVIKLAFYQLGKERHLMSLPHQLYLLYLYPLPLLHPPLV
jgi:hypothetical protein